MPCTDEERKEYPHGQATPVETAEAPVVRRPRRASLSLMGFE